MKSLLSLSVLSLAVGLCWSACEVKWIKDEHIDDLPADAVLATPAENPSGEFYVARAKVPEGNVVTPGRFNYKERQFFYTMDGKEHSLHADFEVLTNPNKCNLNWRRAFGGTFPKGSIEVGTDKNGGKAYSARYHEQFGWMLGKFYPSTNLMYYGWGGGENSKSTYELLTNEDVPFDSTIRPSCPEVVNVNDNFACVCTAAKPCQKIEQLGKTAAGVLTTYTTSYYGKRMVKESGKLEDKGKAVQQENGDNSQVIVKVNRDKKYQTIFGFGGAFTDATGINIKSVDNKLQEMIIDDYFSRDGIEYNMGRIPIGGSDFSTRGYSLDDMTPVDQEDKDLSHFALQPEDLDYKIPIINAAQKVSTHPIKVFGSPWSAPGWLKNGYYKGPEGVFPWVGGGLKGEAGGEFQILYAKYFVKYLEEYKKHNITHWGITVQNEPLAGVPWNSMGYSPESMREFVAKALGPVLEQSGWGVNKLQVMMLDHNVGLVKDWVDKYYADPVASKYTAGTAIHWYGHDPKDMMDAPQAQHPEKWILATEACLEGGAKLGRWDDGFNWYADDILQDLLHHVTGWVDWNMVLDMKGGPNWKNNFVDAPILVDKEKQTYYRQPIFYALAHFSKFLTPGSVRVDAQVVHTNNNHLAYGVFRTPEGATVVITYNKEGVDIDFVVEDDKAPGKLMVKLAPMALQTFVYYD